MIIITQYEKKDIGIIEKEFGGTRFFAATCKGAVVTDFSKSEKESLEEATAVLNDVLNSHIVGLVGFKEAEDLTLDTVICSSQIVKSKEGSHLIIYTMDGEYEELMCFEDDLITCYDITVGMTVGQALLVVQNKMEGGASASA